MHRGFSHSQTCSSANCFLIAETVFLPVLMLQFKYLLERSDKLCSLKENHDCLIGNDAVGIVIPSLQLCALVVLRVVLAQHIFILIPNLHSSSIIAWYALYALSAFLLKKISLQFPNYSALSWQHFEPCFARRR